MCGIAGLIFDELQPDGAAWLTAMAAAMHHRGPDDGGVALYGLGGDPEVHLRLKGHGPENSEQRSSVPLQVGLAARRLAIIDRSDAGHQPMSHGKGQPCIVFNGVICNHRALRDELAAGGMTFRGTSDTEVLLAAYRRWGVDCVSRLAGMWAFAVYDPAAGRLVLCRDRWGIKPLYVARHAGGFAFASEIGALLTLPGFVRMANEPMLRDFLALGLTDHTSRTMFEGVWAVPPGCRIIFELRPTQGRTAGRIETNWPDAERLSASPESPDLGPGDLRRALETAVEEHLVADVPIGSCLSGGLDSSTIVALAHRVAERESAAAGCWSWHTITASLPGSAVDERRYAETMLQAYPRLVGHFVEPTARGMLDQLSRLVRRQEQPFGSPSIYLQWEVMRAAREAGVVVLLDGQGGDELLGGYEGMAPSFLADLLRRGRFGRFLREWSAARKAGGFSAGRLALHTAGNYFPVSLRDSVRLVRARRGHPWLARELFESDPSPDVAEGLGLQFAVRFAPEETPGPGPFARNSWRLLLRESLPALLRYEDRNSMAHSIEARVPMLDHRVADVAMRLPAEAKIRGGVLKAVLRESVADIVPARVRERRDKIGFAAPTVEWMRGGLSEWWRSALGSASFRGRGCASEKGVAELVRRFDRGDDAAALPIWRLAVVEEWARTFMDGK